MAETSWRRGDAIAVRYVRHGEVLFAGSSIVVEDRAERLALFTPMGTPMRWTQIDFEAGTIGRPQPHRWHTTQTLRFLEPGAGYCISAMYAGESGRFLCWYIDMIEPFRRTDDGIVLWDLALDIVASPDLVWKMKDEDHFARLQELRWIAPERAAQVRRDAQAAIARIESRAPPFCEDWPNWRPDPSWPIPPLSADWASI